MNLIAKQEKEQNKKEKQKEAIKKKKHDEQMKNAKMAERQAQSKLKDSTKMPVTEHFSSKDQFSDFSSSGTSAKSMKKNANIIDVTTKGKEPILRTKKGRAT